MRTWLAVLALAICGSIAVAQPRSGDKRGPDPQQDRRAEVKKKIRVLRAATLTDELKLDEKTLSRLLPVLARWDDVTEDLLKKRVDITRRLKAADTVTDQKVVDRLIDEAIGNQKAFWDLEDKRLAELRKILTPGQIARLLVVLPQFERRIQNQLQRAINGGGAGGGRGNNRRMGPKQQLDDDDFDSDDAPRRR